MTENKPCQEADRHKATTRSAAPNGRRGIAPEPKLERPPLWFAIGDRQDAIAELIALQAEYIAWAEALPNALQGTATADALQAIADVDLDELATIKPPRGYGRD